MKALRTLPRSEGDVDFGAERLLLAVSADGRREVWWRKGYTARTGPRGDGRNEYQPGVLMFWQRGDLTGRRVLEGGRMAAAVKRMRTEIDAFIEGTAGIPARVRD